MRLPIYFFRGVSEKPAVVFIHGLGMNALQWMSASEARIFSKYLPFSVVTRFSPEPLIFREKPPILPEKFSIGYATPLNTSFNDLRERRYSVVTWNQTKPLKSIKYAINELKHVVAFAECLSKKGVILIGNSRGGIIARKFFENHNGKIRAVITIATPHKGSSMAKWTNHISKMVEILNPLLKVFPLKMKEISLRLIEFISSEGVKELLPDSSLIQSLSKRKFKAQNIFLIAGTSSTLFNVYEWKQRKEKNDFIIYPEKILSFPQSLINFLPEKIIPSEWKKGDGLVSVESAMNNDGYGKIFELNHAEIIVNKTSRDFILDIVENL